MTTNRWRVALAMVIMAVASLGLGISGLIHPHWTDTGLMTGLPMPIISASCVIGGLFFFGIAIRTAIRGVPRNR